MIGFMKNHYLDLITVIGTIAVLLFLYKKEKIELVKKIVLSLVIQAEKAFGRGMGDIKYFYVVEKTYEVLPTVVKVLITKKDLDNLIEEGVTYMKSYLSKEGRHMDDILNEAEA
ncbi:MAG: hypothetical protein N4A57_04925 [Anaeromicrobium sp.]|jgi:hypothetical protein|uniref:hypothetical protein n=1 Tax=Anaeromicrobium sp. TaxID=1929132 RepID=UPI0025EA9AEC|nr:hypothetical protein [Anaeromicrobium sp.]MCT4593601.1 hypothetical protein [Anaeromicrobium sp.]